MYPFIFTVMKNYIRSFFEGLRKGDLRRGYACDACDKELFDYPAHRLCVACEKKMSAVENPCERCGRQLVSEGLCLDCKATPPKFTKGVSPFIYQGLAASLVNRLKNGNQRFAAYLGERMAEKFFPFVSDASLLIVAVPATKESVLRRGYNQAERLAESVCDSLRKRGVAAEIDFEILQKIRETKPQKRISRKERAENVRGAYFLHKRKSCKDRVILLIDDIMTTGSTGSECAKKLFSAGAKAVYFLTAASLPENK